MKDEEKNLIENLFNRLKKTELNSSERDQEADDLIQKLVKQQPASSYYMAQTILIQETAIKKMSITIEELKKRIEMLNNIEKSSKKPSFLSNFFKTSPISQKISHDNNIWKNNDKTSSPFQNSNATMSTPIAQTIPTVTTTRNSGFLSNALQTATGVAGGMILGNMLMNVFNHSKPEEEIFDTINKPSLNHHIDEHVDENLINNHDTDLINYEANKSDMHTNESNFDFVDKNEFNDVDDTDINDDNFI
ncbi:DUF2076 domain-containing protein [Buchnera aphidicola (Brachycaudus cardui)]|uniref:DUF2076 domain-containing protein n=1 Tax=Buchnera aphidicola (Brachycaudus cardui) TaxID=557993 RepID=A0A4D6XRZ5_9GAMM|nr:DUF2076 domain-containing protein [Buchnera aphidicola]QCI20332.1 DUF2076 domain-containing protein [Buchnera aphidicola (Brachycaudus cardui)]